MFYQGFQTRQNNENHEAVGRVLFYCSRVFGNPGKTRDTSL